MEPDSTFSSTPTQSSGSNNANKILVAISFVLIIVIFSGVSYWLGGRQAKEEAQVLNSQTANPQVTSEPTPAPPTPTLFATPSALPTVTASATPRTFVVTSVYAEASPTTSATCPQTFTFTGTIIANSAGNVTYKWERKDGATYSPKSIAFTEAGTKNVTTTWQLPGPGSYNGWEQLVIVSPNPLSSNQATFFLNCP